MKEEKKLCEVCHKGKAIVGCHYCKKWICEKCYGSWSEVRKCCGRENGD